MRKYYPIPTLLILLTGLLLLAGCNMPSSKTATPDANRMITEAAATAGAELTQSAALNPQPTATMPVVATRTPAQPTPTVEAPANPPAAAATLRPTSASAGSGGDAASFVADVTVPDDTYAAPGAVFVKTWRVKNTGTTTWTPAYGLVWIQGDKMNSPEKIPVPKEVRPGEEVEISVTLTAPTEAGSHQTFFRFQNAGGQNFRLDGSGDLWLKIIVGLPSTNTPVSDETPDADATPTASETPDS